MKWIDRGFLILVAALTGSIAFGLWKAGSRILRRQGRIRGIRMGLVLVILCFWAPVVIPHPVSLVEPLRDAEGAVSFWKAPALPISAAFLIFVWVAGTLLAVAEYLAKKRKTKNFLNRYEAAGDGIQEIARQIRKKLHIRRKIPVFLAEEAPGPFIGGLLNCRIFLPEKTYGEEELRIILEHELWHYKQGDLLLKSLCTGLSWVGWFLPTVKKLPGEVDRWGDICCDLHMCFKGREPWDKRTYFTVVLDNIPEDEARLCPGMRLRRNKEELKERIGTLKRYRPERELKGLRLAFWAVCFTLAVAVSSFALETGMKELYGAVYQATERKAREDESFSSAGNEPRSPIGVDIWQMPPEDNGTI